jgi:uncharacterized protein with HEPN domain
MSAPRLSDYLDHIRQAAADACSFVEGMEESEFLADRRTQQAVIMSLVIIGEAATKLMKRNAGHITWRNAGWFTAACATRAARYSPPWARCGRS